VVIVGNEENGICQNLLKKSDHIIKIPMFGNVQSLNVSVSTGILLSKIING
jgi:23S rRNA (guanosine2251-2'-O)-methyltransferase